MVCISTRFTRLRARVSLFPNRFAHHISRHFKSIIITSPNPETSQIELAVIFVRDYSKPRKRVQKKAALIPEQSGIERRRKSLYKVSVYFGVKGESCASNDASANARGDLYWPIVRAGIGWTIGNGVPLIFTRTMNVVKKSPGATKFKHETCAERDFRWCGEFFGDVLWIELQEEFWAVIEKIYMQHCTFFRAEKHSWEIGFLDVVSWNNTIIPRHYSLTEFFTESSLLWYTLRYQWLTFKVFFLL